MESYPYSEMLFGLVSEGEVILIEDDHRFYPLASSYFRVEHLGGPLHFVALEETTGVHMSLYPVANGFADGPVEAALDRWEVLGPMERQWELPSGGYWLAAIQSLPVSLKV